MLSPGSKHAEADFAELCRVRDKTFCELGTSDPMFGSNSWKLVKDGWSGLCIDKDIEAWRKFSSLERQSFYADGSRMFYLMDLVKEDVAPMLHLQIRDNSIGFLAISLGDDTLKAVERFPWEDWRFGCFCFKHDGYTARKLAMINALDGKGYHLLAENVMHDKGDHAMAFADWWVDPASISANFRHHRYANVHWQDLMAQLKANQ